MSPLQTAYFTERSDWRAWLLAHFEEAPDIWLEYPKKHTGRPRILYNDAVEEALCFGWIDSTVKSLDPDTTIQRFCPRRSNSSFSQPNKERLTWLFENRMIHPSLVAQMQQVIKEPFHFPEDILAVLKTEKEAWQHYRNFSDSYKRIRVAYIDSARKRPEEFEKRLKNFLEKTKANKLIKGFGGIEKYY